ncbi:hypothetical protein AB432_000495 [Brevibacillus brevis]|uniref:Uncharacterized protein n=1 Tax=Brevibacillus brevis TaxID=1393 RepID=A0A2Z4MB21_BREBE|nr:hypothetical protein [Brevibacillus brevis]AWX53658.1 hypothetical protein AB432_000495 [Brevibacillus brevis]
MKCPWCDVQVEKLEGYCLNCGNEFVDFEKKEFSNINNSDLNNVSVPKVEFCAKCQNEMLFLGEQELQRSSPISNLFLGEFGDLLKGTLRLLMFVCKDCGKTEFFVTEDTLLRLKDYGQLD